MKKIVSYLLALCCIISLIPSAHALSMESLLQATMFQDENTTFSIIPPDERNPIQDTDSYPYSAIAKLLVEYKCGCKFHATGFLVSGNCMLTAGHNIWTYCTEDECVSGQYELKYIMAYLGYYAGTYLGMEYITPDTHTIYLDPQYDGYNPLYDYGYIILNDDYSEITGYFNIANIASTVYRNSNTTTVAGYDGYYLYRGIGGLTSVTSTRVFHSCDTLESQSGSPIYINTTTYPYTVFAIHTHGIDEEYYTDWNSGWRITDDLIDHLRENGYLPE